jgi:hypothetical protein
MPIKLFGNYTERLFDAMSNVTTKNERTEINVGTFVERYALDVLGSAGFGKGKKKSTFSLQLSVDLISTT